MHHDKATKAIIIIASLAFSVFMFIAFMIPWAEANVSFPYYYPEIMIAFNVIAISLFIAPSMTVMITGFPAFCILYYLSKNPVRHSQFLLAITGIFALVHFCYPGSLYAALCWIAAVGLGAFFLISVIFFISTIKDIFTPKYRIR